MEAAFGVGIKGRALLLLLLHNRASPDIGTVGRCSLLVARSCWSDHVERCSLCSLCSCPLRVRADMPKYLGHNGQYADVQSSSIFCLGACAYSTGHDCPRVPRSGTVRGPALTVGTAWQCFPVEPA